MVKKLVGIQDNILIDEINANQYTTNNISF